MSSLQGRNSEVQISNALSITQWRSGLPAPEAVATSCSAADGESMYYHFRNNKWVYSWTYTSIFGSDWENLWECNSTFIGYKELNTIIAVIIIFFLMEGGKTNFIPWASLLTKIMYLLAFGRGLIDVYALTQDQFSHHSSYIMPTVKYASVKIFNDSLYIIGGRTGLSWVSSVYKIPLTDILLSKPSSLKSRFGLLEVSRCVVVSLPVVRSTCIAFNNHLLSVGGLKNDQACGDIYRYDQDNDKWDLIGSIPTPRYSCLVEVVNGHLVVVGGWQSQVKKCNLVEIAVLK